MGKKIALKAIACDQVAVQATKTQTSLYTHNEDTRLTLVRIVGYINFVEQAVSFEQSFVGYITHDRDGSNAIDLDTSGSGTVDDRQVETVLWGTNDYVASAASTAGLFGVARYFIDIRAMRKLRQDDVIRLNTRSATDANKVYARYFLTLFFKETN